MCVCVCVCVAWDSAVGIATRYGRSGDRIRIICHTRPDRTWGPPSLLYNHYRVFPGGKRSGRDIDYPAPFSAEVEEGVELYFYPSSDPSWPVLG